MLADRRAQTLIEHIEYLQSAWRQIKYAMPFENLAFCVLPDHLHCVWRLPEDEADYSTRWQRFKAGFSQALPASNRRSDSKRLRREKGIWQRRFWEHTIRDEIDLQQHIDYIHYNPVRHGLVERVADWPYSSFHYFVHRGLLPPDWGGSRVLDQDGPRYGE